MAAALNAHTDEVKQIAGISAQVRRGGKGAPLLVIHGELGMPGWLQSFQHLSETFDVIVPSLPGYGGSERPDWMMSIHDLAAWVTWFARDSGLHAPLNVIGCSLGGWAAAEIATIAPQFFNKLMLVGPMGVKPQAGEIFDYFLDAGMTGIRRNFHAPDQCEEFAQYWGKELTPEENDTIEQHREITCRIAWKPYMHSLTLPALLPSIRAPVLIVQGAQDAVTPLDCGEIYARSIPGARMKTIAGSGHAVEMERSVEFAAMAKDFLSA